MTERIPARERMVWTAMCDCCLNSFAAWPHWENSQDIPDPEEWENSTSCPVCDERMEWEWGDPLRPAIRTGYHEGEFVDPGTQETTNE